MNGCAKSCNEIFGLRIQCARVTSETIGEKLPTGFQRAEFLLEHGFVDQVVPRDQLKERIGFFLNAFRVAGQDLRWSL